MKKLFIVAGLLSLFFAGVAYAADTAVSVAQDDQSLAGTNLSSNTTKNPFSASSMDSSQPQPDTAGQTADDSDSW